MAHPFLLDVPVPGRDPDETKTPEPSNHEQSGTRQAFDGRASKDANAHSSPFDRDCGSTSDSIGQDTDASIEPSKLRDIASKLRADRRDRAVLGLTASDGEGEGGAISSSSFPTQRRGHASPVITIKSESTRDPETPYPSGDITGIQGTRPDLAEPEIKPDPEEESDTTWPAQASGVDIVHGIKRSASHASEEDAEDEKPPPRKRGRAKKEPPPPLYKATAERAKGTSEIPGGLDIDDSVLAKLRKCFERAEHENASEAEARAAMFLAGKLMRQYNVDKAEVMQYKTPEELQQSTGSSEVVIYRRDGATTPIPIRQWVSDLAGAMGIFFDVKTYSSTPKSRFLVRWVFYGIAQNTASAALAFEKIYNLILDWARFKKGIAVTNSYCLGIAAQLRKDAKKEKAEEMEEAKKSEAAQLAIREQEEQSQREKELQRLQPTVEEELEPKPEPKPEPNSQTAEIGGFEGTPGADMSSPKLEADSEDSFDFGSALPNNGNSTTNDDIRSPTNNDEDENESDDDEPDFVNDDEDNEDQQQSGDTDKAIDDIIKNTPAVEAWPQPTSPSPEPTTTFPKESPEPDVQWKSPMQLTVFRETAAKAADEYLKAKGMKLKTRRRGAKAKDAKAFQEGVKDAKKIDVRQKAIDDKEQNIQEKNDG
ncbi:ankyrin repeat protein [Diplodia corticola]|uniref:Ankyrin repeat protein n=1 Tax=Diplodia corticola TaxID=236234 RepID=A0A1J9RUK6_9PEZI|nr:ankyrin repeat protein [Diplodia corticola]OJD36267.1 ankyrin repeat protein [Diplodia corticola]